MLNKLCKNNTNTKALKDNSTWAAHWYQESHDLFPYYIFYFSRSAWYEFVASFKCFGTHSIGIILTKIIVARFRQAIRQNEINFPIQVRGFIGLWTKCWNGIKGWFGFIQFFWCRGQLFFSTTVNCRTFIVYPGRLRCSETVFCVLPFLMSDRRPLIPLSTDCSVSPM